MAHRVAWEMERGPILGRVRLARLCANRRCVNPEHWVSRTTEERFWVLVNKTESCWVWKGTSTKGGYGQFSVPDRAKGRNVLRLAHRISYEMANGPIPSGLDALHTCDNPPCVRPDHLFLGTDSDNQRDAVRKGRHVGSRKLTADEVRTVRQSRATALTLATRFGVTRATIYDIRSRKTWRHI